MLTEMKEVTVKSQLPGKKWFLSTVRYHFEKMIGWLVVLYCHIQQYISYSDKTVVQFVRPSAGHPMPWAARGL